MIARAAALAALAVIAAAIGVGVGNGRARADGRRLMNERYGQRPPQTAVHASRYPAD